ncbi:hypothetical protein [Streptomyces sp. NPDC000983]|uniref:hypothetical protein n=1 Tax=Streptomyces sp. NPDC000983 TaxID=3154373 RepID=UPI00331AC1F2
MLILWGDPLNCFASSFGSASPAKQPDETVESVAVAILGALAEHGFHPTVAKCSVEPTASVDVQAGQFRQLCESSGADQQVHVPQMVVVSDVVGGVALSVGAHQGDGSVPITRMLG